MVGKKKGSPINVLVAATTRDIQAEGIRAAVKRRPDMKLVNDEGDVALVDEADLLLDRMPPLPQCAVILVGPHSATSPWAIRWLTERSDLVVLLVDITGDVVRVSLRDPSMESLLAELRDLVDRVGTQPHRRVVRMHFPIDSPPRAVDDETSQDAPSRSLLEATIAWVHQLLKDAIDIAPDENGRRDGMSVTRANLSALLKLPADRDRESLSPELVEADDALEVARETADASEPLSSADRAFQLSPLEFRMMVLGLAPELDPRYQSCFGFVLDDMGRRVGTSALYSALLGAPTRVRDVLNQGGALAQWAVFEAYAGHPSAADEPLRVDPYLARWLLGERGALDEDPRIRRVLHLTPWPGASLLQRCDDQVSAAHLMRKLLGASESEWLLLGGHDPAGWRALLELGGWETDVRLIRVDAVRLRGVDRLEIEDCARRVGRMASLTGRPLIVDMSGTEETEGEADSLELFLTTLIQRARHAALIYGEEASVLPLLGACRHEIVDRGELSREMRLGVVRTAAAGAGANLISEMVEAISSRFPLHVDGFEHAMRLARTRPLDYAADDPRLARFTSACKDVATEGISHLAEPIDPVFDLDDVVLPPDRKQQLREIVDNVRLAPRVLDEWKFRSQLPYGRGVSALFFGPSGTGKTMAALGIARRLGMQILRLDLSRVVSKYIGDTEKNIDRVFRDAQRSGSAVLIDEADALLGKRSEVKDAHDRYANIEVAYLLQRMEAFEGLAILTTNLRGNLDRAFLRRLRFIVAFPSPDAEAREKIWRQCLPKDSHVLDDAAFRQLARRIDLTGGHIRQITVRAAFIAAAAGTLIKLEHIAQAAGAELAKLGMPPVELDFMGGRKAA